MLVMHHISARGAGPGSCSPGFHCSRCRRRFRKGSRRLAGGQPYGQAPPANHVLDLPLLQRFQHLPRAQQSALAAQIGSSWEVVLALLAEIAAALH